MRYFVIEEKFISSECGEYIGYGIELRENGRVILQISDIDTQREKVNNLCELCNELGLSEIHFMDVVEDYLGQ